MGNRADQAPRLERLLVERPTVSAAREELREARGDLIEELETWRSRLRWARLLGPLAGPLWRAIRRR